MKTTNDIGKYADLLHDRWFKRSFGTEKNKRLLQLLLQELIPERTITELSLAPQEIVNPSDKDKDIRVDISATDSKGRRFIVELQLARQEEFYERAIFNSCLAVIQQVPRGQIGFDFPAVYFIGIMDFSMHEGSDQVLHRYAFRSEDDGELLSDRMQLIFLELPNCSRALTEKASVLDDFCYALRNLPKLQARPQQMRQEIFDLLFNSAEISKFTAEESVRYLNDMTTKRDIENQIAYAQKHGMELGHEAGLAKGREEGVTAEKVAIASNLKTMGLSVDQIATATGLSQDVINALP